MRQGNLGDHKSVGQGVAERRINFGPGYRIYFGRDGDRLIVFVGGGTKSRQNRDIKNAQKMWAEYKGNRSRDNKFENHEIRETYERKGREI